MVFMNDLSYHRMRTQLCFKQCFEKQHTGNTCVSFFTCFTPKKTLRSGHNDAPFTDGQPRQGGGYIGGPTQGVWRKWHVT